MLNLTHYILIFQKHYKRSPIVPSKWSIFVYTIVCKFFNCFLVTDILINLTSSCVAQLAVSLDCLSLIAPLVFSNVYLLTLSNNASIKKNSMGSNSVFSITFYHSDVDVDIIDTTNFQMYVQFNITCSSKCPVVDNKFVSSRSYDVVQGSSW